MFLFLYTRSERDSKVRLRARSFLKVTENKEQKALLRWYLSKSGCPDEATKKQKRAKFTYMGPGLRDWMDFVVFVWGGFSVIGYPK